MLDHDDEHLSKTGLAELESDHLENNQPDDDDSVAFRTFADPASTATELGSAVLDKAVKFLQLPLRENAGVNQDSAGHIRTFFVEGLKWSPDLWDHWLDKHPQSKVVKPEWCAAFGSYCVRKAYEEAGKTLPSRMSASASDLRDKFIAAGRFIRREELFHDDGPIRSEAKAIPGPGDLVVFQGHVGMLRELYVDGSFITVEGNTYKNMPRHDGVYQCNRSSAQKKADGTYKLVGFCLLPSVDGQTPKSAAVPTLDEPDAVTAMDELPEPPPAES